MTLLAPFALLGLFLAAPIAAMYVLKLRRQEHVVGSTFLWRRITEDVQANTPWQRLRPNILLLLQVLALIGLVLALAGPAYSASRTVSGDVVIIVDESYGMQSHDVEPSRFAVAIRRAGQEIRALSPGSVMSIIGMSSQPRLAAAESGDSTSLYRALQSLRPDNSLPNFLGALSLAATLQRSGARTTALVLTSRDSGINALPVSVSFPVTLVRVGGQARDLGITSFSAARIGGRVGAVLRLHNFGRFAAASDVELWADGQLIDVRPISANPGADQNLFWTQLPSSIQTLHVRVTHADDVSQDKQAWYVVPERKTRNVLLVSNGNFFLKTVLGLVPNVNLHTLPPVLFSPAASHGYDVVVFDRFLPKPIPSIPALLVSPPSGTTGALRFGPEQTAGGLSATTFGAQSSVASILLGISLGDVHVAEARVSALPSWLQPIITSGQLSLLAAGEEGTHRLALVNFDLDKSDWPLRISFPLVMQRVLAYLAPAVNIRNPDVSVSQLVDVYTAPGAKAVTVVEPNGQRVEQNPSLQAFADTQQPGQYVVEQAGRTETTYFAVNSFHPSVSPATGSSVLQFSHGANLHSSRSTVYTSFAWVFCLLFVLTLSAEWWWGFRR